MVEFSVIIPLYNKENFVVNTIQSVLNQTYSCFEIIVIDDGSTDHSYDKVRQINDKRIRIFRKKNEGVSVARNYGIHKAINKYITFLDADDIWLPDFLQTINTLVVKYSQAGIYSTAYTLVYPHKRIDKLCKQEIKGASLIIDDYCKSLIKKDIFPLWTGALCVKKELFEKVGDFPEKIKRGEDLDMWLRLSLVSSIAIFNEPKVLYNIETENNAMASYNSYKESFPYWQWYAYGKTQFLKDYATNKIVALMHSALRAKKYKDVVFLFFKVENRMKINALCLTLINFVRLLFDRNR